MYAIVVHNPQVLGSPKKEVVDARVVAEMKKVDQCNFSAEPVNDPDLSLVNDVVRLLGSRTANLS